MGGGLPSGESWKDCCHKSRLRLWPGVGGGGGGWGGRGGAEQGSPVNGSPCKKKRASITGSKCHSEYLFRSNVSKMFLTALSNTASVGLERLFVFRGQCSFILKMNTD